MIGIIRIGGGDKELGNWLRGIVFICHGNAGEKGKKARSVKVCGRWAISFRTKLGQNCVKKCGAA